VIPACYGKSNNPEDSRCKVCALFLPCALATPKVPSGRVDGIGHIGVGPSLRTNDFQPGSRLWAACHAANLMKGSFTEKDLLPLYVGVCHSYGIDPGSAERNVRNVVEQLVKRGLLKRTKRIHLTHVLE